VKRPILGILVAAVLSLGLLGSSPARAITVHSPTAATMTPAHDSDDHGQKYSAHYGQGGTRWHDHDGDDDDDGGHHRRRCSGLIVVCLG
jgi:hypothetical protein